MQINAKVVLISMLVLQLVWIIGIWITQATVDMQKLGVLGVLSILGFLVVSFMGSSLMEYIGSWIDRWAANPHLFLVSLFILMLVGGILFASVQRVWPFDEEQNYASSR